MQVGILISKLIQMRLNPFLIRWYASFFTNMVQRIIISKNLLSVITTNVGASRVVWVLLFSCSALYTDHCCIDEPNQVFWLHQQGVNRVVERCDKNALQIITAKTEKIVFGSQSECQYISTVIHNEKIKYVQSFKYRGVMFGQPLSWTDHTEMIYKKNTWTKGSAVCWGEKESSAVLYTCCHLHPAVL